MRASTSSKLVTHVLYASLGILSVLFLLNNLFSVSVKVRRIRSVVFTLRPAPWETEEHPQRAERRYISVFAADHKQNITAYPDQGIGGAAGVCAASRAHKATGTANSEAVLREAVLTSAEHASHHMSLLLGCESSLHRKHSRGSVGTYWSGRH